MRLDPTTSQIGKDEVTYFSMVSGPGDEHLYKIIGRIAVEFGRLEYLIKAAIEKLSRELALQGGLLEEDVGFVEGMLQAEDKYTFSVCCSYLGQLFARWQSNPDTVSAFDSFVRHLLVTGEQRNAMLHGCWSKADDNSFFRLRSRYDRKSKTLLQSVERFTIPDLDDFYRRVNWQRFLLSISIGGNPGHIVPIAAPEPSMKPSRGAALISKLVPTANRLGIESAILAKTIGFSVEEIAEIIDGQLTLPPESPNYGRASLLLDLLQRLLNRCAGNPEMARRWLNTFHPRLNSSPLEAMQSVEGFIKLSIVPWNE